jgi:hypothetical protein
MSPEAPHKQRATLRCRLGPLHGAIYTTTRETGRLWPAFFIVMWNYKGNGGSLFFPLARFSDLLVATRAY